MNFNSTGSKLRKLITTRIRRCIKAENDINYLAKINNQINYHLARLV